MAGDMVYVAMVPAAKIRDVREPEHKILPGNGDSHAIFGEGSKRAHAHIHTVSCVTRYGTGCCQLCGMHLFSGLWVAPDLFGDARQEFMRERLLSWVDRVNRDAWVEQTLADTVWASVHAMLNPDEPAMLVKPTGCGVCADEQVPQGTCSDCATKPTLTLIEGGRK